MDQIWLGLHCLLHEMFFEFSVPNPQKLGGKEWQMLQWAEM